MNMKPQADIFRELISTLDTALSLMKELCEELAGEARAASIADVIDAANTQGAVDSMLDELSALRNRITGKLADRVMTIEPIIEPIRDRIEEESPQSRLGDQHHPSNFARHQSDMIDTPQSAETTLDIQVPPVESSKSDTEGQTVMPDGTEFKGIRVELHTRGISAWGLWDTFNGRIVLLPDSEINNEERDSLTDTISQFRGHARLDGYLSADDGITSVVQKPILCSSPSAAAKFVVGYSINGQEHWIVSKSGNSLNHHRIATQHAKGQQ